MEKLPIPNYRYDDGQCAVVFGPGFYGVGAPELFGISEQRTTEFDKAIHQAIGHFCYSTTCSNHKDVLPKYEHQSPVGPSTEEMLSLVAYLCEPTTASELACMTFGVMMHAVQEMKQGNASQGLSDIFSQLMGGNAKSPEEEIQELLHTKNDGNSQFGLQIDPTEFKMLLNKAEPWFSYGVRQERNDLIVKHVVLAYNAVAKKYLAGDYADNERADVVATTFNSFVFESVAEQLYFSWLCGIYNTTFKTLRDKADMMGVGKDLSQL